AVSLIAKRAASAGARTAVVLMPARFQTDDFDYGNMDAAVRQGGGVLVRNGASERFARVLAPLGVPTLDLQPSLFAEPDRVGLFFQRNVHLTPRGHRVVGDLLASFLESRVLPPSAAR